jgi:hypothetical protein
MSGMNSGRKEGFREDFTLGFFVAIIDFAWFLLDLRRCF